ncbi:hypothetical protein AKO1_011533 [Acrasis kona]|uniref:Receptor expression-enhancing protein n=1 Tax=Acrasis kona TaxID=1008807 RepID=A0AAW2Z194_9EUKA
MLGAIHVLAYLSSYCVGIIYPIFKTYSCVLEYRKAREDYEVTVKFSKIQARRAREGKGESEDDFMEDATQRQEQLWVEQQEELLFGHKKWLSYWIVFFLLCVFEYLIDRIIDYIPLYYELKLSFILFLILDKTHEPALKYNNLEQEIDSTMVVVQDQAYEKLFSQLGGVKDLGVTGMFTALDKVRQISQAIQKKSEEKTE